MSTCRSQRTVRQGLGGLPLSVTEGLVLSPYFQRSSLQEIGTDRDIRLSLNNMDFLIDSVGVSGGNPYAVISWWNSSNVFQSSSIVFMTWANVKADGLTATVNTAVADYASANSLTVSSVGNLPGKIFGSPAAAIADSPADATTNYNTVTTILGSLTGAVNTANSKQNDIATKLNTLLSELRSLGLISA